MTSIADDERPIPLPSRLAQRLTHLAFGLSSDMMTVTRLDDGCLVETNDAFSRVTDYSAEEAIGQSFTDLGLWVDPSTPKELAEALRKDRSVSGFECELRARSGQMHVEELSASLVSLDGQAYVVGTYRDVTAQRLLERELLRLAALVETSEDAIIGTSVDGVIQSWNRGAERIYGYPAWEVLGRSESLLDPPEADPIARLVPVSEPGPHLEVVRRRKDGALIDVSLTDSPITDRAGVVLGVSSIARDITERRRAEDLTRYLAYHDQMTGLANRALFEEHLNKALSRAQRSHRAVAVLYLDMDNLKLVNDRLGHAAGDELLVQTGERLNQIARQADSVARLGGDEFLVLLADLPLGTDGSSQEAMLAAEEVAGRIREQFQVPYRLADTELTATASIGISIYPIDAMDAAALLRNSDAAMFRSKEARKSEALPRPRPFPRARGSSSMDVRLRRAVDEDPWVLHYQPIVDLASGSVAGAEALIRWPQPDGTLIAPMQFIPLAEELGLIQRIGEWVIHEACRQARAWQDQGLPIPISFNLSPRQLWNPGLADDVAGSLRAEGVDPRGLIVEITESAAMADPIRTELALEALSDQGITIAIDDFGTGYSSLSRLKRLHVSILKTDRSFLSGIPQDAEASRLMTAIVQLARSLGLTPVAEGVEFESQRRFLIEQGCPLAQGNLLGRPTAASELLAERLLIREAGVQVSTLSS